LTPRPPSGTIRPYGYERKRILPHPRSVNNRRRGKTPNSYQSMQNRYFLFLANLHLLLHCSQTHLRAGTLSFVVEPGLLPGKSYTLEQSSSLASGWQPSLIQLDDTSLTIPITLSDSSTAFYRIRIASGYDLTDGFVRQNVNLDSIRNSYDPSNWKMTPLNRACPKRASFCGSMIIADPRTPHYQ